MRNESRDSLGRKASITCILHCPGNKGCILRPHLKELLNWDSLRHTAVSIFECRLRRMQPLNCDTAPVFIVGSVAKSAVFQWNWATFLMLLWVVFLVRRLKRNPLPPKREVEDLEGGAILIAIFPLNMIRLFLALSFEQTWQP